MEVNLHCRIQGKSFSPALVERKTGLPLSEKNESGDMGTYGRYRDKPLPYGACVLSAEEPANLPYGPRLEHLISLLEPHVRTLKECGAEDIVLQMDVCYSAQCNLEFSPTEMRRLACLGVHLAVSCSLMDN